MSFNNNHHCVNADDLRKQTQLNIEKYSLQVIMVSSTNYLPSFAYSVGLWQNFKHPEIICLGLSNDLGHAIINDVAEIVKQGEKLHVEKEYDNIFDSSRAVFLNVSPANIPDYFNAAINYYNRDNFPALQLVWTDRNDQFPWEEGFEEKFLYKQPLLDRNMAFKFSESPNLATFTTRQSIDLDKPILYVIHDYNGDWQFLTGDQLTLDDMKIVALKELVQKDSTLNQVFDLDYGEEAERDFVGGKWKRSKVEYDEESDG